MVLLSKTAIVATEDTWPTIRKILTTWTFTEKILLTLIVFNILKHLQQL